MKTAKLTRQEEAIQKAVAAYAIEKGAVVSDEPAPRLKHGKVTIKLSKTQDFGHLCPQTEILQWRASHPYSLYGYRMISFAGKMVPQLQGVIIDFMFNKIEVV